MPGSPGKKRQKKNKYSYLEQGLKEKATKQVHKSQVNPEEAQRRATVDTWRRRDKSAAARKRRLAHDIAGRKLSQVDRVTDGLEAFHRTPYTSKVEGLTMFPPERPKNFWFPIIAEITSKSISPEFREVLNMYDAYKEQKMQARDHRSRVKRYVGSLQDGAAAGMAEHSSPLIQRSSENHLLI